MDSSTRPRPTPLLRLAFFLIFVMIGYRLWLMQDALLDALDGVGLEDVVVSGGVRSVSPAGLGIDSGALSIPGSLGNPLLFLGLVPLLIVCRRFMRKGYGVAAKVFVGYLGLRMILMLVKGPWNMDALVLFSLMGFIGAVLLLPSSAVWFEECSRWRSAGKPPNHNLVST